MNREQYARRMEKEIIKNGTLNTPATILVGVGLYAKFAADNQVLHPLLNNDLLVNSMLIVGAAIMLRSAHKITSVIKKSAELPNQSH